MNPTRELLLLATEEGVHAFDLARRHRITLGRHASNDLQLSSRTVSNFHAEIVKQDSAVLLRDLGSTNGTFLEGQRIETQSMKSGDQIRLGSHTLTMRLEVSDDSTDGFVRYRRDEQSWGPGTTGRVVSLRSSSEDALKTIHVSDPNDLSLPDLLNRLGRSEGRIRVRLSREGEHCDVLAIKNRIVHAEYGAALGEKALYRVFCWSGCDYEVAGIDNGAETPRTIDLPTETLILEGMKQALEVGRLFATLPPMEARLRLKEDCTLAMTAHSPAEIEVYRAIVRDETIGAVLESCRFTDLRVLKLIESLLRKGVFEVARETPSFQETYISAAGEVSPLKGMDFDS